MQLAELQIMIPILMSVSLYFSDASDVQCWSLSSPEMAPGEAKPHNEPHEVELYFIGADGSKWKAVKWELITK